MTGIVATKTVKGADGVTFTAREWDEGGVGTGPYSAMPVLGDGAGGALALNGRLAVGGLVLLPVTLSLDTSPYASGDLLADTQVVTGAVRVNDGTGILHSVILIDEDDQGVALDLYFLSANNTFGSENSAPSISDANAREILGIVSVATTDYKDLGGVRVAIKTGLNIIIKSASGSTSIYVAAVNGSGTPTYTASGLKLRVGIVQD